MNNINGSVNNMRFNINIPTNVSNIEIELDGSLKFEIDSISDSLLNKDSHVRDHHNKTIYGRNLDAERTSLYVYPYHNHLLDRLSEYYKSTKRNILNNIVLYFKDLGYTDFNKPQRNIGESECVYLDKDLKDYIQTLPKKTSIKSMVSRMIELYIDLLDDDARLYVLN